MKNRGRHFVLAGIAMFFMSGCEYFEKWLPQAKKPEKAANVQPAPKPSINDEKAKLLQEMAAVEKEKQELEQRREEIQNEKEVLSELLQETEIELQNKEREVKRMESRP